MGRHKKQQPIKGNSTNDDQNENNGHGGKSRGIKVYNIPLNLIDIRPGFNPRIYFDEEKLTELRDDIAKRGIQEPLKIQKHDDRFYLVDGERRFTCAKQLKMDRVPAFVLPEAMNEEELLAIAFCSQKAFSLLDIEKGGLFWRMRNNFGKTVQEIADIFAISIANVNQKILVYEKASSEQIEALKRGEIKFTSILKEIQNGKGSHVEKVIDPEKSKRKEEEKELKENVPELLKWMWDVVERSNEKENMDTDDYEYSRKLVEYLLSKYEKFEKKKKKKEKEDVIGNEEFEEEEEEMVGEELNETEEEIGNEEIEEEEEEIEEEFGEEDVDLNLDDIEEIGDLETEDLEITEEDLK